MNANIGLPLAVVLSSLVPGVVIFFLPEANQRMRTLFNLAGAILKMLLVGVMLLGVAAGYTYQTRLPFLPGLDLTLRADALALLFVTLSAILWLLTTIYAIGYLEGSPNRSRFFGFFSLCVSATVGIALAGDLLTFLIFYEILSVTTYPLIVHRGTEVALKAGRVYLMYTLFGGAVLLAAVVWLYHLSGTLEFREQGFLANLAEEHTPVLRILFALFIVGLGVKAALVPLQSWLPIAMVAPAPVSALLHAVAVVKAGAFGIVRVVYDVYGVEFSAALGVLEPLAVVAAVTILYGSLRALSQDELKKRLAFSTVSQIAFLVLGVAIPGPLATTGGLVHLVHQGLMKITLFFCAGNLAETLDIRRVSAMDGVARRMPWTMGAFTVGAFGLIGVPPLAGFITKWYLGVGALEARQPWVIVVLVCSSILNAAYFLPIVHAAWFKPGERPTAEEMPSGRAEASLALLLPTLTTALLSVAVGLFANTFASPLTWARLITLREYAP